MKAIKPLLIAGVVLAVCAVGARAVAGVVLDEVVGGGPTQTADRFELPDGVFDPALLAGYYTPGASGGEWLPWRIGNREVALAMAGNTQQRSNWCWTASIQAIAQYYGQKVEQCDIAENASWLSPVANSCPNMPGTVGDEERGFEYAQVPALAIDRPLTFKEIKTQIDAGRPVFVNLRKNSDPLKGHAVVIRGYDAKTLGVYLLDPTWSEEPERTIGITPWDKSYPYWELLNSTGANPLAKIETPDGGGGVATDKGSSWSSSIIVAPPGRVPTLAAKKKPSIGYEETEWGSFAQPVLLEAATKVPSTQGPLQSLFMAGYLAR